MDAILQNLETFFATYGVAALFVIIALESLGAPLPGETAVIVASGAAAQGDFSILSVAAAAFAGAVLGDNVGYLVGRRLGRPTIIRYGARVGITDAAYDRTEAVAARWGPLMVVVARFVVLLRQLNGIVAGTTGMAWGTFLVANMLGAALWVGLWTTLAYRLGHSPDILPFFWHHLSLVAAVAVPLLIAVLLVVRVRRRRT